MHIFPQFTRFGTVDIFILNMCPIIFLLGMWIHCGIIVLFCPKKVTKTSPWLLCNAAQVWPPKLYERQLSKLHKTRSQNIHQNSKLTPELKICQNQISKLIPELKTYHRTEDIPKPYLKNYSRT